MIEKMKISRLSEDFENLKKTNKEKYDPDNNFPMYSGDEYKWGIKSCSEDIVVNELLDNGDYLLVSHVGDFYAAVSQKGPSFDNPKGKYNVVNNKGVFVATKIKENGEVENHLLFSEYGYELFKENIDLVKNELFSDENIKYAEENNNGYLGNIVKLKDSDEAQISYKDIFASEFVTALSFAKVDNFGNIFENQDSDLEKGNQKENSFEKYRRLMFDYHSELANIFYSNYKCLKDNNEKVEKLFDRKESDERQLGE